MLITSLPISTLALASTFTALPFNSAHNGFVPHTPNAMSPEVSLGRLTSGMNVTPELRPELRSSLTCYISDGNGNGEDADNSKSQPTAEQAKQMIADAEDIADSYQRCLTLNRYFFLWDDIACACKALKRAISASIQIESNEKRLDAIKQSATSLWRVPENEIPFVIDLLLITAQRIKDSSTRADAITELARKVLGGELYESAKWRFFQGALPIAQKIESKGSQLMALSNLADGLAFACSAYYYEDKDAPVKYFEDLIAIAERIDDVYFFRAFLLQRLAFCLATVNFGDRALPLFERLIDEAEQIGYDDNILLKTILFLAAEAGLGDKIEESDDST